ncbi:sulfonate ABC transporter substrate-binding protein [Rhodoferax saidenbachensis]|uniref:Sulfonate transport system substrate-binding protein n=1 Tax=Rhodoferax saidenbachensis TaxID=1484693 RepID=A0ABU1ZQ50_9BURK|nr:sulfonate ABC transporter substrate-binding protein [Rhodoferax saidenbachensis]MDR7307076.1 sulfonate transport system substrate-binding protein [Rhodoferax saidenbachensis]
MAHTTPSVSRRSLLQLLATTAGIWGLSGPVSNTWAQTAAGGSAPELLRIGYQKSAVNLVILKQQAVLEKRFPGTKVQWIEFPAGPQLLEALSVGSLEFGLTGDSPPVFAQAADKDLVYAGAEPPKPDSSAILVLKDSPLQKLEDLRGKKIALQKGSSAHYLLVRAVEKAGLQWTDIQPIYLAPADARAAFERKSVDAWAIWDPFYSATELTLQARALATGRNLSSNNSFYLASKPFATQYAHTIAALFEELTRADRFAQEHRPETIKLISTFSGLDAGVVSLFLQRRPKSPVGPISASIAADQQRVADAFHKLGLIPKTVRVADIVWTPPGGTRLAQAGKP